MLVIADMEWVTYNKNRHFPTQLAACRVDENWNKLSAFRSFIRPHAGGRYDHNNIAYRGGGAPDFLCAPTAKTVLSDFEGWLSDDDIIVWWHKDSMELFGSFVRVFLKTEDTHRAVCAGNFVRAFLSGRSGSRGDTMSRSQRQKGSTDAAQPSVGGDTMSRRQRQRGGTDAAQPSVGGDTMSRRQRQKGGTDAAQPSVGGDMYKPASKCGVNVDPNSALKHYSPHDANVFRELMAALKFPQNELLDPPPAYKKQPASPPYHGAPYQYDSEKNTIHIKDCPRLADGQAHTVGYMI